MKYIILDTETTSTLDDRKITQLGFLVLDESFEIIEKFEANGFAEEKYFDIDAMAATGITPEMVKDCSPIERRTLWGKLESLNVPENVIIAHNSDFDMIALKNHGFENKMQVVDSYSISKHLRGEIINGKVQKHSLQYMRYFYKTYLIEHREGYNISAHNAISDCISLYYVIKEVFINGYDKSIQELIELSKKKYYDKYMYVGKRYNAWNDMRDGKEPVTLEWIANNDRSYLQYILSNFTNLREDYQRSFVHYLTKSEQDDDGLPF